VDLGLLHMKQREYDQAFDVLGNTLCQDPENPKALLTLAAEMQVRYTGDDMNPPHPIPVL